MKEDVGVNYSDMRKVDGHYEIVMTDSQYEQMKSMDFVDSLYVNWEEKGINFNRGVWALFPNNPNYDWSVDNFGPLKIPAKGMKIDLTPENLPLYHRAIGAYEGNTVGSQDGKVYINGEVATSYTFKLDYYWMMGDNRHRSQDSRYFGFVPEDHVVGRPSFVWLSLDQELGWFDGKVRFGRMFKGVE